MSMPDLVPAERLLPRRDADTPPPPAALDADSRSDEKAVGIRDLFAILRRHVWLVLAIAAIPTALAAYAVANDVPQYRARALVRLVDTRRAMTGGLEGQAAEELMGRQSDRLLSQILVLKSRGVVGRVVDGEGLRLQSGTRGFPVSLLTGVSIAPDAQPGTLSLAFNATEVVARFDGREARAAYGQPVVLPGLSFRAARRPDVAQAELTVLTRSAAIDHVINHLAARPRERTDAVDVEYTSPDPRLAQRVVNGILAAFQTANAEEAQEQSRRRRIFVQEQLGQTDSMLFDAQSALSAFRSRERAYSARDRLSAEQAGLMGLDVRREELDSDRSIYRALLTRIRDPRQRGGLQSLVAAPGIAGNPAVTQLYSQLVRFETSRDSLRTGEWRSAGTSPDVERLDQLVAATEQKLVAAVESHLTMLDARVAALDDLKRRSTIEIEALPAAEAEEVRLTQRVETINRLADQLREEHQRARIAEAVEMGQVAVVDSASFPEAPVQQRRRLKLALGLIFGLMLGGGAAVMREQMNTAISGKADLESGLELPVLAVVPRMALKPMRKKPWGRATPSAASASELASVADPTSVQAEAFRTLRTNIIFSQWLHKVRTLVVSSATPAEGKTTVAANLAAAYAQQGLRVLLVDVDLRRARLHEMFGLPRVPGFTELVLGLHDLEKAVQESGVPGLSVITSGTLPPNPGELVGSPEMLQVMGRLSKEFDIVIYDSPPLLAASDAAILGRAADGVLLVCRAGKTERAAAQAALSQLSRVGARVLGGVLNDADEQIAKYGGYYAYQYGS
jgi:capsular exopolysaccharide synthesis family protein